MEKGKFTITIYEDDIYYKHFKKRFLQRIGYDINFKNYMLYQNKYKESVPYKKKDTALTIRFKHNSKATKLKANIIFNSKKRLVTIIPVKYNNPLLQNEYKNKIISKDLLK